MSEWKSTGKHDKAIGKGDESCQQRPRDTQVERLIFDLYWKQVKKTTSATGELKRTERHSGNQYLTVSHLSVL